MEYEPINIQVLRKQIDKIDEALLMQLGVRFELVVQLGAIKAHQKIAVVDEARKTEVLNNWKDLGQQLGLSSCFVESLYLLIHAESVRIQHSDVTGA